MICVTICKQNYNKLIKLKRNIKGGSFIEKITIVIYSYRIPQKKKLGKGSAIFIHLTKNYKSTVMYCFKK